MLFNSLEFLVFLPLVFILYWYVFKKLKQQNLLVIFISYVFYGWWDWRFLTLIAFTTFSSYISGILIEKREGKRKQQKYIAAANIVLNLAILCLFKYFNFFSENLNKLFQVFGWGLDWVTLDLLLPVGISFYTFQALSYSIDVYQKKITPTHDISAFFAFISFFPQLVAGPIERATHLLPQFLSERKFNYSQAVDGLRQILWGFFKKVVVADNCANVVNTIFDSYQTQSGSTLLLGAFLFAFQIYGDFSGYSDIAIGTARLFGINLMKNFNYPYFSHNIAEFWRRWHISLTTWFRDYIYIPLGGSRVSKIKIIRNTFIIFLVSGFWHGANWTFVLWGILHGAGDVLTRIFHKSWDRLHAAFRWFATFGFISATFLIFRADSISQAFIMFRKVLTVESLTITPTLFDGLTLPEIVHLEELLHLDGILSRINGFHMWAFLAIAMFIVLNTRNCYEKEFKPKVSNALATVGMLTWCVLSMSGISTFLYFNF